MGSRQFKAESKRLLDLMINSVYTNREIFLRELISNASDALDKLHYISLTDKSMKIKKEDLKINIAIDKEKRTLTIEDNGCGMDENELDKNLGTIAKSGSLEFKEENEKKSGIDIIGQFGVGFYSAFMVSKEVVVESKSIHSEVAYKWTSKGADGYSIEQCDKKENGTKIILFIKDDTEDEKYSNFLEQTEIQVLVKKYSDYIGYPIEMELEHIHENEGKEEIHKEIATLNSMIPIWKKDKKSVKKEEYDNFYCEKFNDFIPPLYMIQSKAEGQYNYRALLYIPSHLPYNYYSQEFKKGLQLYSNGVLIMNNCEDLLPEYFGFIKGLVDSEDVSLNLSREMLQQDRQLRVIAKNIESKIRSELENMLKSDREKYDKFFETYGTQLKFGTYNNYGVNKEKLQELLMFYSSTRKKLVTLAEYVEQMPSEQTAIYYANGESVEKIDLLPQIEQIKDKGYEILYLTEEIDEFVFREIANYQGKNFQNASGDKVDLDSDEEKDQLDKENEENKGMFELMKEAIPGEVQSIRFTHRLKNHPVCLSTKGEISVEMQKALNQMPNNPDIKATTVLEINENHEIANKLKSLYGVDDEKLKKYTKVLLAQAKLIEGLDIDNPTEISNLMCEIMVD